MNRDQALQLVKKQLGDGPRFKHTLRVVDTAIMLAKKFGANPDHAELAALFHDYAKLMDLAQLKNKLMKTKEDPRLLQYNSELWHGPVAAVIIEEEFGIANQDIINAIRYHTTGRKGMTLLEKVIYLADYIEPGRNFPGVEETRALANVHLDQALLKALSNTIQHLVVKKSTIFPDTFEAYNDMIMQGGNHF